jgi:hypothetical protein
VYFELDPVGGLSVSSSESSKRVLQIHNLLLDPHATAPKNFFCTSVPDFKPTGLSVFSA